MTHAPDKSAITLLIVDDHPVLREGIAAMVAVQPDIILLGEASTADEAVALFLSLGPDVTLVDIQMADADGIAAIRQIRAAQPAARILVLTAIGGEAETLDALRAGAAGYLLKPALRRELIDAIRAAHEGRSAPAPRSRADG